ncbi:hypothetical protein LCGC14_0365610 [marine sediment metagenome]|uniref:Uncharacterized protein n=1 Tax=marine sediment metagenome TaxID=412755 RepID=A0A0F9T6S4_9ZZZZ
MTKQEEIQECGLLLNQEYELTGSFNWCPFCKAFNKGTPDDCDYCYKAETLTAEVLYDD